MAAQTVLLVDAEPCSLKIASMGRYKKEKEKKKKEHQFVVGGIVVRWLAL